MSKVAVFCKDRDGKRVVDRYGNHDQVARVEFTAAALVVHHDAGETTYPNGEWLALDVVYSAD